MQEILCPDPGSFFLWIDASKIYGENFQLAPILDVVILRKKNISGFVRNHSEISTESFGNCLPVRLDNNEICPRLKVSKFQTQIEGLGDEYSKEISEKAKLKDFPQAYIVPLLISEVLESTNISMCSQKSPEDTQYWWSKLNETEMFGMEIGRIYTAEQWEREICEKQSAILDVKASKESLPERFQNAALWDYEMVKKQHPVYTTSSGVFGQKAPSQHDLVTQYSAIKGGLNGYGNANSRRTGLRTGMLLSKVHQSLDGWWRYPAKFRYQQ